MNKAISIALVLAGILALWGAGREHSNLLELRRDHRVDVGEPLEDVPPLVAFSTVALGGFTGIIADYLWIRSAQMQREGRYFEVVQLADWITKLEPRFTEAWVYHAWNMTYNISVMFTHPEERWRWVRHGIHLLRDEALRYNPANPVLHRELSWLFFHKIGGDTDMAHAHYKRAWAREMSELFNGGFPDYEALAREHPERLRRMRAEYRLDPSMMQALENEFGALDWRLPQSHAVYWAWRGRRYAEDFELLATDRMIFQGMADLFYTGRQIEHAEEGLFLTEPLMDALPGAVHAFERAVEEHPDVDSVRVAHSVFLHRAILLLYVHGRDEPARELFAQLRERYPAPHTEQGFEVFLFHEYTGDPNVLTEENVMNAIRRALFDSFFWVALSDEERAAGHERLALLCWRLYMEPRLMDPAYHERVEEWPSLDRLRRQALRDARARFRSEAARGRLDEVEAAL